jgi:hypothetical protein
MVPGHNKLVSGKSGGTSLSPAVTDAKITEIFFPFKVPVHVVAVNSTRAERGYDMLPVSYGRAGCPASIIVTTIVWSLNPGDTPPDEAAVLPINGMDFVAVLVTLAHHTVERIAAFRTFPLCGNSRQDVNVISPYNGS